MKLRIMCFILVLLTVFTSTWAGARREAARETSAPWSGGEMTADQNDPMFSLHLAAFSSSVTDDEIKWYVSPDIRYHFGSQNEGNQGYIGATFIKELGSLSELDISDLRLDLFQEIILKADDFFNPINNFSRLTAYASYRKHLVTVKSEFNMYLGYAMEENTLHDRLPKKRNGSYWNVLIEYNAGLKLPYSGSEDMSLQSILGFRRADAFHIADSTWIDNSALFGASTEFDFLDDFSIILQMFAQNSLSMNVLFGDFLLNGEIILRGRSTDLLDDSGYGSHDQIDFLISHELSFQAAYFADRFMVRGGPVISGDPDDVFNRVKISADITLSL